MRTKATLALVVGVLILGLVAAGVVLWQRFAEASAWPAEISVSEAKLKQAAGALVLDVRTPEEWAEAHLAGATLIPLQELERRIAELPRDREIVVMCRSGNRSATGRDILRDGGFVQVTSMAGGIKEWMAAGYPTLSGP